MGNDTWILMADYCLKSIAGCWLILMADSLLFDGWMLFDFDGLLLFEVDIYNKHTVHRPVVRRPDKLSTG